MLRLRRWQIRLLSPAQAIKIPAALYRTDAETAQAQKMVDVYKRIVKEEYGAEVNEWVAGGLTDGNRTAKFVPTLDALGVENYDEHTDHESVDLNTAVPRTTAFALTLAELAETF